MTAIGLALAGGLVAGGCTFAPQVSMLNNRSGAQMEYVDRGSASGAAQHVAPEGGATISDNNTGLPTKTAGGGEPHATDNEARVTRAEVPMPPPRLEPSKP